MNFGIYPNPQRDNSIQISLNIIDKLIEFGAKVLIPSEFKSIANGKCEIMSCDDVLKNSDLVISVGGDGSIIRCAKMAAVYDVPVLGVNAGRIGYLSSLEPNDLDKLKMLFNDDYNIENRLMLNVCVGNQEYYALNDAVISRGVQTRLIDIVLNVDGHIIPYRADGVIVSTPTGSTAYSLSAGGPVLEPKSNNIIISPVCPYALFSRSLVLDGGSEITLSVKNVEKPVYLSIDGNNPIAITDKDKVIIRRSDKYSKIVNLSNISFYDVLLNKLK